MILKDAKDQALAVYNEKATQYNVPTVPVHEHNGTDSSQIPFPNLLNAQQYRVLRNITLTSTQILALKDTPITIVPAQGAGSVIIVEHVTAKITYNTTTYTGANAIETRYTDASGVKVTADIPSTLIDSVATAYYHAPAVATGFVPIANSPIVVCIPTANPAVGNSPITLAVVYRVVSFNT